MPDIFDAPDDRPKLRTCDCCLEQEQEAGEFRQCEECGEVTCRVHSADFRPTLCLQCGEDADLKTCEECGAEGVDTRVFSFGGVHEPRYQERMCASCIGWPRWQKALQDECEPDPDRERDAEYERG